MIRAPITSTGTPNKQLYEDMDFLIKQIDEDLKTPKKSLLVKDATPVKEAKGIAQNGAAKLIQNAIRGKKARNEMQSKAATRIQSAIRRRQPQQQFRAQQNIATQVGAQTKRILTNKAQIKRFETEISNLDQPAARASTTERRNERRPIVETGLNILRRNQIKQAEGRPRTRTGQIVENETLKSTASTIAKGPKKQ